LQLTWTDVVFVCSIRIIISYAKYTKGLAEDFIQEFPKLFGLMQRVEQLPVIAAWLKESHDSIV
jgi:hypothetical protein